MTTPEFDRWYSQEMRAPDGSYIKRLQDATPEELAAAADAVAWLLLLEREAFGTIHGRPIQKSASNGAI